MNTPYDNIVCTCVGVRVCRSFIESDSSAEVRRVHARHGGSASSIDRCAAARSRGASSLQKTRKHRMIGRLCVCVCVYVRLFVCRMVMARHRKGIRLRRDARRSRTKAKRCIKKKKKKETTHTLLEPRATLTSPRARSRRAAERNVSKREKNID